MQRDLNSPEIAELQTQSDVKAKDNGQEYVSDACKRFRLLNEKIESRTNLNDRTNSGVKGNISPTS